MFRTNNTKKSFPTPNLKSAHTKAAKGDCSDSGSGRYDIRRRRDVQPKERIQAVTTSDMEADKAASEIIVIFALDELVMGPF